MSFLASVQLPGGTTQKSTTKSGGGSFLSSVTTATPEQSKLANLQQQGAADTLASQKANSFGGLFNETLKGLSTFAGIKDTLTSIKNDIFNIKDNLPTAPKSALGFIFTPASINDPQKFIQESLPVIKDSFNQEKDNINNLFNTPGGQGVKIGQTAKAIAGGAGLLLSPISAFFKGAETIPVVGTAAKLMDAAFTTIGSGAVITSNALIDSLPVSQQVKDNIKPGIGEVFALASQLLLGKAGDIGLKKIELARKYGPTDAQAIVNKATELANKEKPATPVNKQGGFLETVAKPGEVQASVAPEYVPRTINEGTGVSKVGQSIEAGAIEKGLTQGFEGTAGFDPVTVKEQARLVSDLVTNDLERAKRFVTADEPIPSNIRVASLIKGLEDYAVKNGDAGLLRDLANSPLVSETSRFAQELRLLQERTPDSPVTMISDVQKAREVNANKAAGGKIEKVKQNTVKEIKQSIAKETKQTWSQFIDEIKCKY